MKNKKGFTLIELLAVIAILGIILTISIVAVTGLINRSTDKGYETIQDQMLSAAKKYFAENISEFPQTTVEQTFYVPLGNLILKGYLEVVKDPNTKGDCTYTNSIQTVGTSSLGNTSYVTIKIPASTSTTPNKYSYTVRVRCNNTNFDRTY